MNWDFTTAKELLGLCEQTNSRIPEIMIQREMQLGSVSRESVIAEVDHRLRVMDVAVGKALSDPAISMGGLIGGQAEKLNKLDREKSVCGPVIHNAIVNALAVSETNASMGVIVAAPTAGAAGVLPAVLLAAYEKLGIDMRTLRGGLICAGAIGYLMTRNASVAGAEAGCQAEVGTASAMAAAALVHIRGGSPEQCCNAASVALSNLLGLVCDPVKGLVEVPCQTRNAIGATGAFTAAELTLAGVGVPIELDEMIRVVYEVGRKIPESLRETARGGCAAAKLCTACR